MKGASAVIVKTGWTQWMSVEGLKSAAIEPRCTVVSVTRGIGALNEVEVVAVTLNHGGEFRPPQPPWVPSFGPTRT